MAQAHSYEHAIWHLPGSNMSCIYRVIRYPFVSKNEPRLTLFEYYIMDAEIRKFLQNIICKNTQSIPIHM